MNIALRVVAVLIALTPARSLAQHGASGDRMGNATLVVPSRVVVDVRIDDNLHRALIARDPGHGEILLPLLDLLTFAGLPFHTRFGVIAARGIGQRPAFRLDPRRGTIRIDGNQVPLEAGDLRVEGDVLYVSGALAARLLDVTIAIDIANASVLLRDAASLPVSRRWAAVHAAHRADSVRATVAAAVDLTPGNRTAVQADYGAFLRRSAQTIPTGSGAASSAGRSSTISVDFESRLSARVRGGSLSGRVTTTSGGAPVRDVVWARTRPTSTRLTHFVVGALDAGGLTGARVQGFSLDNFPVDYSSRRTMRVRGRAADGWEYTALQDGVWNTADIVNDGQYEFRLPMIGDVARVDVVAWGPDGQERRYVRSVHAAPMRVQRGEFQYATTAGRCSRERNTSLLLRDGETNCDWFAGADSRFGIADWLVVRSGIDAIPGALAPYIGIGGLIGRAVTVQAATTVGGSVARHGAWSAQYEPTPSFALALARSTAITGVTTDIASLHLAPLRWSGRYALDGWMTGSDGATARSRITHAGFIGMRNGVRLELFAARTDISSANGTATRVNAAGVDVTAAPPWLRLPKVQRVWLSGSAERPDIGAWHVAYRVNGSLSRAYVEIARTFATTNAPARWTFTLTPRSSRVRQSTSYARTDGVGGRPARSTLLHAVSGSAAWEPGEHLLAFSAEPATNRGSIVGWAFLDLNANGRQDGVEPGVGDLVVTVGNRALTTDSTGRFRSPHMTASELIDISVDSTTMPSACWRAAATHWRVRATEGGVTSVSLPILRGGVLEGQIENVQPAADPVRLAPIHWTEPPRLQLVSLATGTAYDIDVFINGTFYLLGVPFGSYALRVPADDQRRLQITVPESRVEIAPSMVDNATDGSLYNGCPLSTVIVRAHSRVPPSDDTRLVRADSPIATVASTPRRIAVTDVSGAKADSTPAARGLPAGRRRRATSATTTSRPRKPRRPTSAVKNACVAAAGGRLFITSPLWLLHDCSNGRHWKP